MKIAIQGHPTRGEEVIQILESLGGKNKHNFFGDSIVYYYFIDKQKNINWFSKWNILNGYKCYTLEEFEKEFPFKIGDKVFHNRNKATIEMFVPRETCYYIRYENSPVGPNYTKWVKTSELEPCILQFGDIVLCNNLKGEIIYRRAELDYYGIKVLSGEHFGKFIYTLRNDIKLMQKERNITLTLDKAKEWYKQGGELKEIALQAYTKEELNPLPKSWEEYCKRYKVPAMIFGPYIPNKYVALWRLEQLRNCYRQGWVPDSKPRTWAIWNNTKSLNIDELYCKTFLSFQSNEIANEFLKNFESLIKEADDLI